MRMWPLSGIQPLSRSAGNILTATEDKLFKLLARFSI